MHLSIVISNLIITFAACSVINQIIPVHILSYSNLSDSFVVALNERFDFTLFPQEIRDYIIRVIAYLNPFEPAFDC